MPLVRIQPELGDKQLLRLFYLGARAGWTSQDFAQPWVTGLGPDGQRALARMITPVYLGEQTAMLGASAALTRFAASGQGSYTVYLATFIADEARHLEALTRLYQQMGQEPLRIRDLPDMLRYHHRMRLSQHIHTWAFGILVSDVFARHFYQALARSFGRDPLGTMSRRIIQDESRHQAFAEHYLRSVIPHLDEASLAELWSLKEDLLGLVRSMSRQLAPDARALGIDPGAFFDRFAAETEERAARVGLPPCRRACGRCEPAEAPSPEAQAPCAGCWVDELTRAVSPPPQG